MFTGIIETFGKVKEIHKEEENLRFVVETDITSELQIDQSVSHNGICLTVTKISGNQYDVVAVKETLDKTTLGSLQVGDIVNIERAMMVGDRLDGHIVQGHVDGKATLKKIVEADGSHEFYFELDPHLDFFLVNKGSVCIDGVSLTVVETQDKNFHVAIIPYTYEHTIFHTYQPGGRVNIEFDVLGKYIQQYLQKIKL